MKGWLLLTALAHATTGDPYLVESKVQADLENSLSRIIRKEHYLVQVNVKVANHPTKKMFEAEVNVNAQPEPQRRPAAEITAGFVPEPDVNAIPPAKEERQTYRYIDTPVVEAIRVQIQVDDKLPEPIINQARALTNAYLSANYPDLGSLRVTEVTMMKQEWWEKAQSQPWLGWIACLGLLCLFYFRRQPVPAAAVTAEKSTASATPSVLPAPTPAPSPNDEARKKLMNRIVMRADCLRGYYNRLSAEHQAELLAILKGPAFESLLEKLALVPSKLPPPDEIKLERILWHEKNFDELVETNDWQERQLFGFLSHLTDEQLATLALKEDPKTVCLMLRFMKPSQAATILDNFSKEKKLEILSHVSTLKTASLSEVNAIENQLRSAMRILPTHFFGLGREDSTFWGQVLGESKEQEHLADALEKTQADLLPYMKKLRFRLEDALSLDPTVMDKVLNDVDNDVVSLALVSCDKDTTASFLKVLPQKRRELVEQQIASSSASPKDIVHGARQTLTNKFRENLV